QLIQTDNNGTSKELGIRSVDFEFSAKGRLLMVPNPAVAQTKVVFPLGTNKIVLVDLLGKVLKTIKVSPLEVERTFTVSSLATATYLVHSYGDYGVLSTKLIKVN
ncbi:MAG: T9SS type A sorting domain-containing protein, partial [Pedobacter sp.]